VETGCSERSIMLQLDPSDYGSGIYLECEGCLGPLSDNPGLCQLPILNPTAVGASCHPASRPSR
jgi:hypothetical protein